MHVSTQEQPSYTRVCESRCRRMCESMCGWVQGQVQAQALECMQMRMQV